MNKRLIVTLLLQLSFSFIYSQTKITKELAREINEQIFDTDNYPKTIMPSNKRYEPIKGSIEEETIFYSDSIKIINTYNKTGSLLKSKSFKKNILRGEYDYDLHYKETEMDLFNNQKGREIANGAGLLWQLVKTSLENGELRYLSNLDPNSTIPGTCNATSSSVLIPTN